MNSGIYTITNKVDGKMYVGLSRNMHTRLQGHKAQLKKNIHENQHLQYAWNVHGEDNFLFEVLEEWPLKMLYCMEHYWCNLLNTHDDKYGYNIQPTDPNGLCTKVSEETRKKQSILRKGKPGIKGRKLSEETRRKISESRKGIKMSDEFKQKCSERMKGNNNIKNYNPDEATRKEIYKRISEANKGRVSNMLGYKHTEETKKRMSESRKGKKKAWNPDTAPERKRRISEAMKGRTLSEETKQKISDVKKGNKFRLGIKHSEEDREKIREGVRKAKDKISASRMGNTNKLGYRMTDEQKKIMREKMAATILRKKQSNDKGTDTISNKEEL